MKTVLETSNDTFSYLSNEIVCIRKKGIQQQQQQHHIEKDDGVYLRAMRQVMILLFMIIVCHTG